MKPERIQLSRAKNSRMPPNTVKVDRSTKWGNPFNKTQIGVPFPPPNGEEYPQRIVLFRGEPSLDRCLDLYLVSLLLRVVVDPKITEPLRGKNLACWCKPGAPCHADILLEVANR